MRIAVLGTGLLGKPVAERLQAAGHSVIAYNRTRHKAEPLRAAGISITTSPEEAIGGSECVILLLSDIAAIRTVLLSPGSRAQLRGRAVIQMGTISPLESQDLERECQGVMADYLEAPVLGSVAEARAGTLLVMVGARPDQFARWREVFRSLGSDPRFVGSIGKAAALKLALNQLIAAQISAFGLSLGLIQRAGVPVNTFMEILRNSALFASAFDKKLPRLLDRDYTKPNFSTQHLLKDVDLFLKEATALGLDTSSLDGIRPLLTKTIARGLVELDYSGVYDVINPAS